MRMVCCDWMVGNVELVAEMEPESMSELGATVRGDVGGDAKTGDPLMYEGLGAVGCSGRGHGNVLHPADGAVNDGKEMSVACRRRQRTHQIDVQVLKVGEGDQYGYWQPVHVAVNLGTAGREYTVLSESTHTWQR